MVNKTYECHKSSIGSMDANVMALLAYIVSVVIGWIPGLRYFAWLAPLVIYFIEKDSAFVKFHAMQAFMLEVLGGVITFILTVIIGGIVGAAMYNPYNAYAAVGITGIVALLAGIISIIITIFAIIAMVNAYRYKEYCIPIVGNITSKIVNKSEKK